MAKIFVLTAVLLGLTACGDTWGQRAVTGGGIGAGSGALIGGAVGAGVGAATTPKK
jgi:osmotically inducible lipoprotein OsmB